LRNIDEIDFDAALQYPTLRGFSRPYELGHEQTVLSRLETASVLAETLRGASA
jgi:hypothetical protein